MSLQQVMCWYLVLTLSIVGAYDVYAVLFIGGDTTVSYEIYNLGKRFPTLYLLIGLLIGHIIFPLHVSGSPRPIVPPLPPNKDNDGAQPIAVQNEKELSPLQSMQSHLNN